MNNDGKFFEVKMSKMINFSFLALNFTKKTCITYSKVYMNIIII